MTEDMYYNLGRLRDRIWEAVRATDLDALFGALASIKGPTLVCGCGGSSVVGAYMAKVLEKKNSIACSFTDTRDVVYRNTEGWENVVAVSYSGTKLSVDAVAGAPLRRYMFSAGEREEFIPLRYGVSERETSYISMSATFIPMAMLFLYYTDGDTELLRDVLDRGFSVTEPSAGTRICEILSGEESSAAAKFLESTMTEAGLCAPVVHDKYNFCHGRINLNNRLGNSLIYFRNGKEIDAVFTDVLLKRYGSVCVLDPEYEDSVVNDYRLCLESLDICMRMAQSRGIDLSMIEECDVNDIFYRYSGEI